MAKLEVKGITELLDELEALNNQTEAIIKQGIYEGAKVLTDEYRKSVQSIPVGGKKRINPIQKRGLEEGLGISNMKTENGMIYVDIGIVGYNDLKTRKYPKGQPNPMIANSLEKGTEYLEKHSVARPMLNRMRKIAVNAFEDKVKAVIQQMVGR